MFNGFFYFERKGFREIKSNETKSTELLHLKIKIKPQKVF